MRTETMRTLRRIRDEVAGASVDVPDLANLFDAVERLIQALVDDEEATRRGIPDMEIIDD